MAIGSHNPPTRARFWTHTDKGLVRITLRRDQSLTHVEGGRNDEGYSYTVTTYSFDGEKVMVEYATDARDCDGPISRGGKSFAFLDELAWVSSEDCQHAFPLWHSFKSDEWQRDAFAEAAGY